MPWIIDYPLVLDQLRSGQGLRCLYFNSGAFAFPPAVEAIEVVWADDLARRFATAWTRVVLGTAWVMPMSHWNHELTNNDDNAAALSAVLERIGIDAGQLAQRTNAAAIEFGESEVESMFALIERLVSTGGSGGFQIAFPRRPALCAIERGGGAMRWTTPDRSIADELSKIGTSEAAATDDTDAHR
jgi:hypothetical protein